MKKSFITILIISLLFLNSCKKDEPMEELPLWLIEIINEQDNCFSCSVTRYLYNGEYYYNYYCGYMSCMYCSFFDYSGKKIEWNQEQMSHFLENYKETKEIWKCNDDL